jgi:hypothetical protein
MKHRFLFIVAAAIAVALPPLFGQQPIEPAPTARVDTSAGLPAPSRPPRRSPNGSYGKGTTFLPTSKGDSIPPVTIWFSDPDPESGAGLEEDLFVMARVISRTLERAETDKVNYKLGVPMLLTGSGRSVRPMYIEGLGPLFMIKVSFPLLPPPPRREAAPRKRGAADSEWDEAHRDVFDGDETWAEEGERDSTYKEAQVDLLKRELIGSLKSASNMRGIKPDEYVNIAVFGHAPPVRIKSVSYKPGESGLGFPATVVFDKEGAANAGKGSVLTLRARKRDIDALAAGEIDAEAFKGKVASATYPGSGIGITSINSWIQEDSGRFRSR